MRKQNSKRILSRTAPERAALMRNLTKSLLEHGSIVTTEARGKELKRFVEPLVTDAKKELTLARRRRLISTLKDKNRLQSLLDVAQRYNTRPGGYLRLTHLPRTRGDFARTVRVDFV